MAGYRDAAGLALDDYPRPSIAVDTAVLSVADGGLVVALVRSPEGLGLPGTFLHVDEVLDDAVRRSLRQKAGIEGLHPEQLHVFDRPGRDDRGWVLSVAHLDVVPLERLPTTGIELLPVVAATGLLFDHDEIVRLAAARVRRRHAEHPDPDRLLPDEFTLRDLQRLHEAVAGAPLPKDSFRRGMEQRLTPTGGTSSGGLGKPARLWRHG